MMNYVSSVAGRGGGGGATLDRCGGGRQAEKSESHVKGDREHTPRIFF